MAAHAAVTTLPPSGSYGPGPIAKGILFVLPTLAAIGGRLPVIPLAGVNIFAFRLAVMVSAFFPLLVAPRLAWLKDSLLQYYALLGAVWLIWGAFGVFWAPGTVAAVVNVLAVAFGFLTVLALVNLRANTESGVGWLFRGWVVAAMAAGAVAMWEFFTGQHLPGSWVNNTPTYVQRFVVVSTFDNPNNYGAFLLLVSAVVLYQLDNTRSALVRWSLFVFVLWLFALAILTTSKIAVAGLMIVIVLYLMRVVRSKLTAIVLAAAIVGGLLTSMTYLVGDLDLLAELVLIGSGGLNIGQSTLSRVNLFLAGLEMTASTYGMGVGGGNYSYLMTRGYSRLWTRRVVDPHNWWMEIMSQYGVVIFLMYFAVLAYVTLYALRSTSDRGSLARYMLTFVVAFVLSGFANSSYMFQSTNWLFLGTILMAVSYTRRQPSSARHAGVTPVAADTMVPAGANS